MSLVPILCQSFESDLSFDNGRLYLELLVFAPAMDILLKLSVFLAFAPAMDILLKLAFIVLLNKTIW